MTMFPKHSLIVCPRKNHAIGYTAEALKASDPLKFSAVRFSADQYRIQGEPYKCKKCGSVYFLDGKLHTVEGWLPGDPVIEPVKKHRTFSARRPLCQGKAEAKQAECLKEHRKDKKDKRTTPSTHKEARP